MKQGDFYRHFNKNTEYYFCSVALPLKEFTGKKEQLEEIGVAQDADTPKGEAIQEVQLYSLFGVTFINKETPHVIYQSENDYNTNKVWAREVDEFFGYKNDNGVLKKRFTLVEDK